MGIAEGELQIPINLFAAYACHPMQEEGQKIR
jgi:hypothetical protein